MKQAVMHTVCAWCERVRTSTGEWRKVDEVELSEPTTTHGICPDCLERTTTHATMAPTVAG